MAGFPWRKWNNILHRDIGYVIVALTLIYAISGIAVNHIEDWNPNYVRTREFFEIPPIEATERDAIVAEVLSHLKVEEEPNEAFRSDPETLLLFFSDRNYSVDLPTGNVMVEQNRRRAVLFEMNALHLNRPKKLWTWIADAYALALIVVSITGMFVLKGKHGITQNATIHLYTAMTNFFLQHLLGE